MLVALHVAVQISHDGAVLLRRRLVAGKMRLHQRGKPLRQFLQHLAIEFFLAAEMMQQRLLGDAQGAGNLGNRHAVIAALGKHLQRRGNQRLLSVGKFRAHPPAIAKA